MVLKLSDILSDDSSITAGGNHSARRRRITTGSLCVVLQDGFKTLQGIDLSDLSGLRSDCTVHMSRRLPTRALETRVRPGSVAVPAGTVRYNFHLVRDRQSYDLLTCVT